MCNHSACTSGPDAHNRIGPRATAAYFKLYGLHNSLTTYGRLTISFYNLDLSAVHKNSAPGPPLHTPAVDTHKRMMPIHMSRNWIKSWTELINFTANVYRLNFKTHINGLLSTPQNKQSTLHLNSFVHLLTLKRQWLIIQYFRFCVEQGNAFLLFSKIELRAAPEHQVKLFPFTWSF